MAGRRIIGTARPLPDCSRRALPRLSRRGGAGGQPFLDAAGRASARELPRLRPTDRRAAARPTAECPEQYSGQSRLHASDRPDRRRGGALAGGAGSGDRGAARSRCRERFRACAAGSSRRGSREWLTPSAQLADALEACWPAIARPNQLPPPGEWQVWLLLAGRGFGKTRTLAEWVCQQAASGKAGRIAVVAATAADARDVLVAKAAFWRSRRRG